LNLDDTLKVSFSSTVGETQPTLTLVAIFRQRLVQ
jgi:hypothetical protein